MQSVTPECTHSGLGSSAFARRYLRNRVFFLFLRVLRCFSSGGSLRTAIWFTARWYGIAVPGFPIRISPDQCSFAAPRSFSQLVTSFIGSWCQGIPLALLLAWPSSQQTSYHSPRRKRQVSFIPLLLLFKSKSTFRFEISGSQIIIE